MSTPVKPEPGTTQATTALTPPQTPIQKAVAEARVALAKSAADAAAKAGQSTGAGETTPATEEAKPTTDGAAAAGETTEAAGEPKPGEGEAKPEGEGEAKPEGDAAATTEVTDIVVEIPARRPGEKPLKLAVEDEDTAERIRQLNKSAMRRDDYNRAKAAIDRDREELELVEQQMQVDPIGFLAEQVKPELRVEVAKHLLSIPEVYDAVRAELDDWQDDNIRARRQAELRGDRAEGRRTADSQLRAMQDARRIGRMIRETVDGIQPAEIGDDEGAMFRDDCLNDVAVYARAHPELKSLRAEEVVRIVDRRLRHYGITPEQALAALSSGQPVRRPTAPGQSAKAPAPGIPDENAARTAGAKLKQEGDARRAAAAVPGAGAGARPAKVEPPSQQGVKERIGFLRKQLFG